MSVSSAGLQQPSEENGVVTEVVRVREHFLQLLSLGSSASHHGGPLSISCLQDMLDRFNLWVGSLGAARHSKSRFSLEQRLARAPDVLRHIREHLSEMQESLQDASQVFKSQPQQTEQAASSVSAVEEDSPSLQDLEAEIAECIRSLFRIALVVKSASSRDRFAKALASSQYAFLDQFDINYVIEKNPKLKTTGEKWLGVRLGSGIAKRRQFIKYCYEHKRRLDEGTDEDPSEKQSTKATTLDIHKLNERAVQSADDDEEDGDAASIMTSTTISDRSNALSLPKLSSLSPTGHPFECPICSTLQSFKSDKAWKSHAFRDLKPYLCTRGSTEDCGRLFFADRSSWFQHELSMHLSSYKCSLCGEKSTPGRTWLQKHFSENHPELDKDQVTNLVDMGVEVPRSFHAQQCPFCDEWATLLSKRLGQPAAAHVKVSISRFKRHVATHQEDLALFALPRDANLATDGPTDGASASTIEDDEEDLTTEAEGHSPSEEERAAVRAAITPMTMKTDTTDRNRKAIREERLREVVETLDAEAIIEDDLFSLGEQVEEQLGDVKKRLLSDPAIRKQVDELTSLSKGKTPSPGLGELVSLVDTMKMQDNEGEEIAKEAAGERARLSSEADMDVKAEAKGAAETKATDDKQQLKRTEVENEGYGLKDSTRNQGDEQARRIREVGVVGSPVTPGEFKSCTLQ